MTAHITIIVAMLVSAFQTSACTFHSKRLSELAPVSDGVRHCCHHSLQESGGSLPCPAHPNCCCRADAFAMLVDGQESGIDLKSQPVVHHVSVDDAFNLRVVTRVEVLRTNSSLIANGGGRALLLRTHRLLI